MTEGGTGPDQHGANRPPPVRHALVVGSDTPVGMAECNTGCVPVGPR